MQQQRCKDYDLLLKEFTVYREQSVVEKEQMKRQIEKCRQQLEKLVGKLDKRVDARINQERMVVAHRIDQMQKQHEQEMQRMKTLLARKDSVIEEMRYLLRTVEAQKRNLIQNNTKVLVELSQGFQSKGQKPNAAIDQNYRELLKMYQFLIEENNQLKKDIYIHKRNLATGNNQSFLIKEEKSLNNSQYRQKSLAQSSKGDIAIVNKSIVRYKDKQKDKQKRPPTQKQVKK